MLERFALNLNSGYSQLFSKFLDFQDTIIQKCIAKNKLVPYFLIMIICRKPHFSFIIVYCKQNKICCASR